MPKYVRTTFTRQSWNAIGLIFSWLAIIIGIMKANLTCVRPLLGYKCPPKKQRQEHSARPGGPQLLVRLH
jgi:hypothetical protein